MKNGNKVRKNYLAEYPDIQRIVSIIPPSICSSSIYLSVHLLSIYLSIYLPIYILCLMKENSFGKKKLSRCTNREPFSYWLSSFHWGRIDMREKLTFNVIHIGQMALLRSNQIFLKSAWWRTCVHKKHKAKKIFWSEQDFQRVLWCVWVGKEMRLLQIGKQAIWEDEFHRVTEVNQGE